MGLSNRILLLLLLMILCNWCISREYYGQYLNCLRMNNDEKIPYKKIDSIKSVYTVENCLNMCLKDDYRYAGIQLTKGCFCISNIIAQNEGECITECPGNTTEFCGGIEAMSIYATGHYIPAAPTSMEIFHKGETFMDTRWTMSNVTNGIIKHYQIKATYLETNAIRPLDPVITWNSPNDTFEAVLPNLHPGTKYNISIAAVSELGRGDVISETAWTRIGEPTLPEDADILKKSKDCLVIKLKPYENDNGPFTAMQVVVFTENNALFNQNDLKNYEEAKKEEIPYYIAAELKPEQINQNFTVGDGKIYGGYLNAKLANPEDSKICLGVISIQNGVRKLVYTVNSDYRSFPNNLKPTTPIDDTGISLLNMFLMFFIILSSGLFVILAIVFVLVKLKFSRRRREQPYRQELTVQGPIEINNGYIDEEFEDSCNHYERLKMQLLSISIKSITVTNDVVYIGTFGYVMKGKAVDIPPHSDLCLYVIEDGRLNKAEKKKMLMQLCNNINTDKQMNLYGLIGICEITDRLLVVFPHCAEKIRLKNILIRSRRMSDHNVVYTKFTTFSEEKAYNIAVAIARGMEFLADKNIIHKKLNSRNIILEDDVAKVTGFGLADFYEEGFIPDYTRWDAVEIMKGFSHVKKSDIWSYGCLLWEIFSIGGTPYFQHETNEIFDNIANKLMRLPKLRGVGDYLYDLMVSCWQNDTDERPSFTQIIQQLEFIIQEKFVSELDFTTYPNLEMIPYIAKYEFISQREDVADFEKNVSLAHLIDPADGFAADF